MAETEVLTPEQDALNSVQRAFDKVAPDKLKQVVKEEVRSQTPEVRQEPKTEAPPTKTEDTKLPAFLEKSMGDKPDLPKEEPAEEPPSEISEKAKSNWVKLREKKDAAEKSASDLQKKIAELEKRGKEPDEATVAKLQKLESDNQRMAESLTRFGLEQSEEFQAKVTRPLHNSYQRAKQIVAEAGGDVEALDKALGLSGRAHYDALDSVFEGIPQSARNAADKQLETFRELSLVRQNALRNAPQNLEQIRKAELLRQKQTLDTQKIEFERTFDNVTDRMTNVDKFELFQESKEPETAWWNQIKPRIIQEAKTDYLNATEPSVVAEAAIARRSLPIVTELWKRALERAVKAEKALADINGSQPSLRESGGGGGSAAADAEDDKLTFPKLFLKELKKPKK